MIQLALLLSVVAAILGTGCAGGKASKAESGQEIRRPRMATDPQPIKTQPSRKVHEDAIHKIAFEHFLTATIYEDEGRFLQASEAYKRALQYHPNSYYLRHSFSSALFKLGQYADVIDALDPITPVDGAVQRLRAAAFRRQGIADSASHYSKLAIELDPDNTGPYAYLAQYYEATGHADSALWTYRELARINPIDHNLWLEIGRLYAVDREFLEAQSAFERAIEALPTDENVVAYVRLGEVLRERGKIDSATTVFREGLEVAPRSLILNRILASHYMSGDSLAEALPYALAIARNVPDELSGHRRVGVVYYFLDSLRQADSVFAQLMARGDEDPLTYTYRGMVASQQENLEDARKYLNYALEADSQSVDAYLNLGYVYKKSKEFDKEIALYESAIEKVTDSSATVKVFLSLGWAYEKKGEFAKSVETLESLLKIAPDNANGLNTLGYMLADRGERLEYAKGLIERAVELEPNNAAFLDSYGWVYFRLEEFDKALVYLKRAAELDNDPVILDHLGDAYEATGDLEKARRWWQEALVNDPDNEKIKQKLGN